MARRFSIQSVDKFNKALHRYNSMAGKAKADKLDKEQILRDLVSTEELKQFTKRLQDYKKITDFEKIKINSFEITKGELNTAKRIVKTEKTIKTRELNKINRAIYEVEKLGIEVPQELIEKRSNLKSNYGNILNIDTLEAFEQRIKSAERKQLKRDVRAQMRYKANYLKRIRYLQDQTGRDLSFVIKKIGSKSLNWFMKWSEQFPLSDFRYDFDDNITVNSLISEYERGLME